MPPIKSIKPGLPVNIKKPSIPQSSNAMGASGTILNNVNVRPTRWQTAKHDAKFPFKGESTVEKIGNTLLTAPLSVASAFNVASGQARYNKNKRAGLERGEKTFKVRNSSIPLAETEFND
jgi:hypothetical protein